MYAQDIAGSMAHARMLGGQVSFRRGYPGHYRGLQSIQKRIESGEFEFDIKDEDIHMSIERALIEDIELRAPASIRAEAETIQDHYRYASVC